MATSPAWLLPDEPTPVRFMNTIWADTHGVHDELTGPAALRDWLRAATDYDSAATPTRDEFDDALRLRDSLRRLAAHTTDDGRPTAQSPVTGIDDAVEAVNAALADRPGTELAVRDGRLQALDRRRASPCRSALAGLAYEALELLTGPDAVNLRACNAPHCVLYFVKSHPRREWCSEACGNRVRAARHYQRVRGRR
ncbi:MAG: ABATE domain-containing protein [Actinomycetota bacterium]|nr:ABATE domain-containing protein [Actinomycetota bacterium]